MKQRLVRLVKSIAAAGAAILMLTVVHIGLRVTSYRRLCKWLIRLSPKPTGTPDRHRARETVRLLEQITRSPLFRSNCLRRSLTLWWMLRWLNIETSIHFGINKDEAHAWVVIDGRVLNDRWDIASSYAIVYSDPLAPENIARHKFS